MGTTVGAVAGIGVIAAGLYIARAAYARYRWWMGPAAAG